MPKNKLRTKIKSINSSNSSGNENEKCRCVVMKRVLKLIDVEGSLNLKKFGVYFFMSM